MKFKSQVFTQASGSIGGQTFSHNRFGMYTRARTIPTNPNSTRQNIVRGAFASAVVAWGELTDIQRLAWKTYADNVPVINSLGDAVNLTGQQMFIRSRTAGLNASQIAIDNGWTMAIPLPATAPIDFNTGEPITGFVDNPTAPGTGNIEVNMTLQPASANAYFLLFMGRPVSPAVNFYRGPYQLAMIEAVGATDTTAIVDVGTGDWGADVIPVPGMITPIRAQLLYVDNRLSLPYEEIVVWGTSSS